MKNKIIGTCSIQSIKSLLLAGLIVFIPLVFDISVKSNFSTPKLFTLRVVTLLIFLLVGIEILFDKKFKYRKNVLNPLVGFYGFISILNTFLSVNIYSSLYGYPGIFMGIFTLINMLVVYLLFANLIEGEKPIKKLLFVSVFTSVIISIYGLLQNFGFIDISNFTQTETGRLFGTFGHPNHFGAYLGMNMPVALGLLFYSVKNKDFSTRASRSLEMTKKGLARNDKFHIKNWQISAFYILAIIVQGLCLILTASRGALAAVIISIFFFFALFLAWIFPKIKNKKRLIFAIFAGLTLLIIFFGISFNKISSFKIVERTKETVELIKEGKYPDRISWILSSFEMIKDNPVIGFGLSTYNDIYNGYRRSDYQVPGDIQDEITPENAHNEYLTIAVTQGLPALILYLLILINFYYQTIKTVFKNRKNLSGIILLGVLGGSTVYIIQVFVSFGVVSTMTLFFALMGLGIGLSSEINKQKFKTINFKKSFQYFVFAAIIGIFLWGMFYTIRQFQAEKNIKLAITAENNGNFDESLVYYDIANVLMPNSYNYFSYRADTSFNAYLLTKREEYLEEAKDSYKKAIEINNLHPSSFANQGFVYYTLYNLHKKDRDYRIFYKSFENAVRLSPNNPLYLYKFAKMLFGLGEYGEAEKYFKKALEIRSPYKDTENYLEKISSP